MPVSSPPPPIPLPCFWVSQETVDETMAIHLHHAVRITINVELFSLHNAARLTHNMHSKEKYNILRAGHVICA